jgi:hypothetical protein
MLRFYRYGIRSAHVLSSERDQRRRRIRDAPFARAAWAEASTFRASRAGRINCRDIRDEIAGNIEDERGIASPQTHSRYCVLAAAGF